jgi:hypothetical protein
MRRSLVHSLSPVVRWIPLVGALLATSCGGGKASVEGKVLQGGSPAKGAVVIFHPKGDNSITAQRPSGIVGEDGTFTLSMGKSGEGVAAGEYLVTITWPEEAGPAKLTSGTELPPPTPDRLQGRYSDPSKSGFSAVVKPGKNQLPPFEIK